MIWIGGENFSEEFILGRFVCSVEAAQKFVKSGKDLLRKRGGYLILILPAFAQNRGQSARIFKCATSGVNSKQIWRTWKAMAQVLAAQWVQDVFKCASGFAIWRTW